MARRGRGGLPLAVPVERGETVYADTTELTDGKAEPSEEEPQGPPGSLLEVKRIDEIYETKTGEWTTRDSIVTHSSKKEKDKHAVYAFTVNRRFQPTGDKGVHIVTTSLDIKSEHLREVGKAVIGQVQGISWTSRPLKVSAIDVKGCYQIDNLV